MYIKYIVLLCITYYCIPTVNSYDQDVEDLFDKIRNIDNNYITFDDMCCYFEGDDLDEIMRVIQKYGTSENGEHRMNFKAFVKAANEGRIPKFPRAAIRKVFMEILSGANRDYITIDDMVEYYGELYKPQLERVLSDFGKMQNKEYRLTFPDFRRAVNVDALPKPD